MWCGWCHVYDCTDRHFHTTAGYGITWRFPSWMVPSLSDTSEPRKSQNSMTCIKWSSSFPRATVASNFCTSSHTFAATPGFENPRVLCNRQSSTHRCCSSFPAGNCTDSQPARADFMPRVKACARHRLHRLFEPLLAGDFCDSNNLKLWAGRLWIN